MKGKGASGGKMVEKLDRQGTAKGLDGFPILPLGVEPLVGRGASDEDGPGKDPLQMRRGGEDRVPLRQAVR